jgi:hypothetical protein
MTVDSILTAVHRLSGTFKILLQYHFSGSAGERVLHRNQTLYSPSGNGWRKERRQAVGRIQWMMSEKAMQHED